MANVGTFLKEVKEELQKVTWAGKEETIGTTVVVLVLVILISVFIGIVDIGLSKIIQFIVG
ncbi:preprotein translocase subunit SecE [Deferribacteraceae bacterium V6Fe1]|uniref:preprotein translocase subunit SecE n=1 Tax=Deferrivibrio essentukiensis TaxID=2880922 RepID=UPI0019A15874|nr:preprotein translocase subunit SecE [Deferribacterales bacterium]MCB4205137.1 preprotein translocase subunit SecE [Deferrivibrio essentukiensis]UOD33746.1 preprotein translocase subunit SecE [Deferribacteraceae bacterium V6Fe1]